MKKLFIVLVVIIAILAALVVFKNIVIKVAAEKAIKSATGFGLKMGSFDLKLIDSSVAIKDLKLFNPEDFEEPMMVDIPEIFLDYELKPIFAGKIHVKDIRFHLKEMVVVTNEKGETNINRLKSLQPEKKAEEGKPKEEEPKEKKKRELVIDHLALKVDQVRMMDFSKGGEPRKREIKINLNYEASDITNLNALVSLIVAKTMMSAGLSNLMAVDPTGVLSNVTGIVGDTTGKVIGETTETLKKTTEGIKGLIKSPFGSKE